MANASDITIQVVDSCNNNAVIASDNSYDFRKRIRLVQSQITGRCLVMRATAFATPPGGITVFTSDYFHSGTNADSQH